MTSISPSSFAAIEEMRTMNPTAINNLTAAVAAWVIAVLPRLGRDQYEMWESMLEGRCDVAVEVRLRKGCITLVAIDDAEVTTAELYREDVGPLRPDTGSAMISTGASR
jgi:hypothetical protein